LRAKHHPALLPDLSHVTAAANLVIWIYAEFGKMMEIIWAWIGKTFTWLLISGCE
jgi:hypothetical protein